MTELIEAFMQDAVLPHLAPRLSRAEAIKALRALERSSAPPHGCGIAWSRLSAKSAPSTGQAVAEGTACNCKAGLNLDRGAVVGLEFSMAC